MLKYDEDSLEAFIANNIGVDAVTRFRPKIDRLITLYIQFRVMRDWLDDNIVAAGSKDYKEQVTALNAMMQNIRNLEEDISLFSEKKREVVSNNMLSNMMKKDKDKGDSLVSG